jgi:hypothetical protein
MLRRNCLDVELNGVTSSLSETREWVVCCKSTLLGSSDSFTLLELRSRTAPSPTRPIHNTKTNLGQVNLVKLI